MSYPDEVREFLCRSENLRLALEISEYTQKIKNDIDSKFWNSLSRLTKQSLKECQIKNWVTYLNFKEGKNYNALYLYQTEYYLQGPVKADFNALEFCVQEDARGICIGLSWSNGENKKENYYETAKDLCVKLENENYENTHYFVGKQYQREWEEDSKINLLVQISENPNKFFEENILGEFFKLFSKHRVEAEETNKKLKHNT
jgi:hypothetical protein